MRHIRTIRTILMVGIDKRPRAFGTNYIILKLICLKTEKCDLGNHSPKVRD